MNEIENSTYKRKEVKRVITEYMRERQGHIEREVEVRHDKSEQ